MAEAAVKHFVKRAFPGVTERCVPEVVPERNRFGEVLVQPQGACYCARNLRHFERMGKAGAVVVTLGRQKHLGFMFQAAKRVAV